MALREVITVGRSPFAETLATGEKGHAGDTGADRRIWWKRCTLRTVSGWRRSQIGEMVRVIVIELPEDEDVPGSGQALHHRQSGNRQDGSRETEIAIEGCLSIPGYVGEVERATEVVVRGLDVRGKPFRLRPRDYLARVFQHEIDHCERRALHRPPDCSGSHLAGQRRRGRASRGGHGAAQERARKEAQAQPAEAFAD